MLGRHFEIKTPATNRTSLCWGTTSRPRHRQQIYILGHRLTKTPATNRTSQGTTSRPRHRQQIVHLSAGAPLRDQDTCNKSYIFLLGHQLTKTPATNLHSGATNRTSSCLLGGVPLRGQDTGNKLYILVLGHNFETKTATTNRASSCWGTTSKPRHQQQIVHLSAGAPLRDHDTSNKSYILVLGHHFEDTGNKTYIFHHFETKTPETNRTSLC